MRVRIMLLIWTLLIWQQGAAQKKDTLKYSLISADVNVSQPLKGYIVVEFGKSFPKQYADLQQDEVLSQRGPGNPVGVEVSQSLSNGGTDWLVRSVDRMTHAKTDISVLSVRTIGGATANLVALEIPDNAPIDVKKYKVTVLFEQGNYPEVDLGPQVKEPSGTFTPAKGKNDADIYISGQANAIRGGGPTYTVDAKGGYSFDLKRWGALGPSSTYNVDNKSTADADSITASGNYRKNFILDVGTGIVLDSDFLKWEFDRENKNRNLVSSWEGRVAMPSVHLGEEKFATMDIAFGFDGGRNEKNSLVTTGSGRIWRWTGGADGYFVALNVFGLQSIKLSTEYRARLPRDPEVMVPNPKTKIVVLSTKARHDVSTDLDFMFTKAFGITLGYRYGMVPPLYKMVNNKVTLGLKFQLAQTNK